MKNKINNTLIITAAGTGSRMGLGYNKMLHQINGEYILNITLKKFIKYSEFGEIMVVINEKEVQDVEKIIIKDPRVRIVFGGRERQYSVNNALTLARGRYIHVHDGARCNISDDLIKRTLMAITTNEDAYVCAVPVKDSIREVKNNQISKILDRESIFRMQTPQIAKRQILKSAHKIAKDQVILETDEVGLLYRLGIGIQIIDGEYTNIKMTTKDDLGAYDESL